MKNKAIFLDRDGTIIQDSGYLHQVEHISWEPHVMDFLHFAKTNGFLLIVLTNQSGVARGFFNKENIDHIHDSLQFQLHQMSGVEIDDFYYCPHLPDGTVPQYSMACDCRKPGDGMFKKAIDDWNIDVNASFAIGDRVRDLVPAYKVGIPNLFLYTSNKSEQLHADIKVNSFSCWSEFLKDFREWLLS